MDARFSRREFLGSAAAAGISVAAGSSAAAPAPPAHGLTRRLLGRTGYRASTLALGMALGLFAQIGLVAHLFSLLTPALGAQQAGLAMGLATAPLAPVLRRYALATLAVILVAHAVTPAQIPEVAVGRRLHFLVTWNLAVLRVAHDP